MIHFSTEEDAKLKADFLAGENEKIYIEDCTYQIVYKPNEVILIPRYEAGTTGDDGDDLSGVRSGDPSSSSVPYDSCDYQQGGLRYRQAVERAKELQTSRKEYEQNHV